MTRRRLLEPGSWTQLTLDSGAFTVWRQGDSIDLDAYIGFILTHRSLLTSYVNLDVMPGQPGSVRSPAQTEAAAKNSYDNALRMRKAGLTPIPVFHMGERWYWLERMVAEGFDYLGLGGMAVAGDKARGPWIREAFSRLCGGAPYSRVKVHGFGVTSTTMMSAFPWASVDSVTWMKQGVNGSIYVPRSRDGEYDYELPPYALSVSLANKSGPSAATLGHQTHYLSAGPALKQYVDQYLEQEGMKVEVLADDYEERIRLNARFYKRYADQHSARPYESRRVGLFAGGFAGGICPSLRPHDFHLIFSVGTYLEYANLLRREDCHDQLISYHRVATGPKFDLENYVRTGWFIRNSMKGKKDPASGERCGRRKLKV